MTYMGRVLAGAVGANWATGRPWLAVLLLLAGSPATAKVRSDWSKVQMVKPGKRMAVLLYDNEAARGKRKIVGRFASATAESVTLLLPEGRSQTLDRRAVRKVRAVRPIKKRYPGWIALGAVGGAWQAFVSRVDTTKSFKAVLHTLVTLPALPILLRATRMGEIYNVPQRLHHIP